MENKQKYFQMASLGQKVEPYNPTTTDRQDTSEQSFLTSPQNSSNLPLYQMPPQPQGMPIFYPEFHPPGTLPPPGMPPHHMLYHPHQIQQPVIIPIQSNPTTTQNIIPPILQAPDFKEHYIYNPDLLYKIESKGTQLAQCPTCRKNVQTVVDHKAGAGSWASAIGIACLGGWLGCCLIPFFAKDCMDTVHHCPICSKEIGKKAFLFNDRN